MKKGITLLLSLCCIVQVYAAVSLTSYLTPEDKTRLKHVFDGAEPISDLATAYYKVLGYKSLGETVPKAAEICKYAQSNVDAKNVESIYYASGIGKALGNCALNNAGFQSTINAALAEGATSTVLYYAVSASKNLGLNVDSAKVSKLLTASRKNDDSAQSLGYAFHVASQLSGDVSSYVSWIEDTVVQADEVDGQFLQFEGGLSLSAIVISGIYRLADHAKKAPPGLDADKCLKFTNYLLSRKQVQHVRAGYYLLYALQTLSNNKYHIPITVSIIKPTVHVSKPVVTLFVSNAFGTSLGQISGSMESATKVGESTSVSIKKPLSPVKGDAQLFEFDLAPFKLGRGFHQLAVNVNAAKPDPRWIGNTNVVVKLITEAAIENFEIGVGDVDQTTPVKLSLVKYPQKLSNVLEADYHQKIQLKFSLKDAVANSLMNVHQAFLLLNHKETNREVIFVAEAESTNGYKFEMDIHSKAKLFGSLSGTYNAILIIGDSIISNPVMWHFADVVITFQDGITSIPKGESDQQPKPEIKHLFRQPEKRPLPVVSMTFSILVLVPLLVLLILWAKIGINVSDFNFSLGTIGFHLGLASIFGLFTMFWLQMNMFTTLKCLIGLGCLTFFSGNRMLRKIAENRK